MTFKVCHVWYQIEGFNTGPLFIIQNFNFDFNWSKVIAKEGQKVIPTYPEWQERLNKTIFKYVMCGIKVKVLYFVQYVYAIKQ